MQNFNALTTHDMICHEHDHELCHEGINTHSICHDSGILYKQSLVSECVANDSECEISDSNERKEFQDNRLSKDEWWYLVNTLDSWRVFNPRAVIKKNPVLAWHCMNLCKDNNVRVPGAYFTRCFKNELFKLEIKKELKNKLAI